MPVSQKTRKRDTRPQVTYKGIEKETQVAVRKAASKTKQTIGVWVNKTLRKAAQQELGKKPPPPPLDIAKELEDQRALLETVASELQALKNKPTLLQRIGLKGIPKT